MVIRRIQLRGLEVDVAGAAAVLGLLAAGYFIVLRGPIADVRQGQALQAKQQAAAHSIGALQKEYISRFRKLEEGRQVLSTRAGWLQHPNLPDEVLERVSELARQCDVRIIRWQPQGAQTFAEYQARLFSVEGVASWPALLRWCALMEEGAPLLDVTHFIVNAPVNVGQTGCEFSCSLKLYMGAGTEVAQIAAVSP